MGELRETQLVIKEIAEQIQSGNFSLSDESYMELKEDYLAFAITMVDILNGAAYLFDKKPDSDSRHWKEVLELAEYRVTFHGMENWYQLIICNYVMFMLKLKK